MVARTQRFEIPRRFKQKPLQTGKFISILTALGLAIAGFFRIVNAKAIFGNSLLGDGQFLALVALPVVSLSLVGLVLIETLVGGYRSFRSDQTLREQVAGRSGYLLLRSLEAGIAILGVVVIKTALSVLVADSTPAPAGVGVMLLLFAVGLGILCVSLVRSAAELFVYDETN